MSKKDRRRIRASCAAALAQARWLISLEHGRRLLARLLAMRGSVARGATAGVLAASLALSPVQARGPFGSERPLGSGQPELVDIDNDGDLDVFVGTSDGKVRYFLNGNVGEQFDFTSTFFEQTGSANPFDGIDFGDNAWPAFVDIDGDGDQDAFIGGTGFSLAFYRNDGTSEEPDLNDPPPAEHPLNGRPLDQGIGQVRPAFADIDGDGDQDAFFGRDDGTITYFENTGTSTSPEFPAAGVDNALGGIDGGSNVVLEFADLNGDNVLDLVMASDDNTFKYFQNTGSTTSPTLVEQTGTDNPFNGITMTSNTAVSLGNLDDDSDLDALLGNQNNAIRFYINDGTVQNASFTNVNETPFAGVDVGNYAHPTFGDLDGDGDFDAFVGAEDGTVRYFQNDGNNNFVEQTGVNNPLNAVGVNASATPALVDIDNDSDLDVFIGEYEYYYDNQILFYENTGSQTFAERTGSANPLNAFRYNYFGAPSFVDIDDDGDLDAFIGKRDGTIEYYRNDDPNPSNPTSPNFVLDNAGNPLAAVALSGNAYAAPAFVDYDNDGDPDVFIGVRNGDVVFLRNNGGTFSQETPPNNPFAGRSDISAPAFVDIDADGDPDAFGGLRDGTIAYFENLAVPPTPVDFTANVSTTTQIDLSWTDNSNVETGFVIQRSPDGTEGNWTDIATTDPNVTSFSDTNVTANTTYFYRIKTVNGNFDSAFTEPISANTSQQATPTGLAATVNEATPDVTLSWTDPSDSEIGFRVERSTDGGETWTPLTDLDPDTTSYVDDTVLPGNSYDYRVLTLGAGEALNSSPSTSVTAEIPGLAAPGNLASSSVTTSTVTLGWDSLTGAAGFIVERSTDGGETWTEVASLPAGTDSYTDEGLQPDTEYQYRVTTVGGEGVPNSAPSDPITVRTDAIGQEPDEPTIYLPLIYSP